MSFFNYPGKSCHAGSFAIDTDFINYSPPDYSELTVPAEVLENARALCFRADWGDDRHTYQKYGGHQLKIKPVYKLMLTVEKVQNKLFIRSNTAVSQWRFMRSDQVMSLYSHIYGNDCSQSVFNSDRRVPQSGNSPYGGMGGGPGPAYQHPPTIYDRSAIQTSSGDGGLVLAIDLAEGDYGMQYCIEAVDEQGSRAYIGSSVIASDLWIDVIQSGRQLTASVDQPERVAEWLAVKTSGACSHFSFTGQTNAKRVPSFEMTRRDHNRYYCFKVKDRHGGYAFGRSKLVFIYAIPQGGPTALMEQFKDVMLVKIEGISSRQLSFLAKDQRVFRVSEAVCDENAVNNGVARDAGIATYSATNLIALEPADIGHYFCAVLDYKGGVSRYSLSPQITAAARQNDGGELRVDFFQSGDTLVGRANQNVAWLHQSSVSNGSDCTASLPGPVGGGPPAEPRQHTYEELYSDVNDHHYCFKIWLAGSSESSYIVSPSIQGIEREPQRPEYPYQTPAFIESGQDLADFLRPYLTEKGQVILDGINDISLEPRGSFKCGGRFAGGCYSGGSIRIAWNGNFEDPSLQAIEFYSILNTFIHEFMHAVDYQDPSIDGLSGLAWQCTDDGRLSDIFGAGGSNPAFQRYLQCLDNSHFLFSQLRLLYDDLPEDLYLGAASGFTHYQKLSNIFGRWGNQDWAYEYQKLTPSWHTELYAESVSIRHLPPLLEEHYDQYFKNRLDIVDIYEVQP